MIEQSLVYIHSTMPARRFVGCGTLVEGGYVATCRHVWRMATEAAAKKQPDTALTVEIEYPRTYQDEATVKSPASLAHNCQETGGPSPDLVLLQPVTMPSDLMTLQLATDARFESGPGYALIGLAGRDPNNPNVPEDVRIDGKIA